MLTKTSNQVIQAPYKKNVIINGNFDIWQRGVSFPNAQAVTISADRWKRASSNDAAVTLAAGTHNAMLGNRFTKYALGVSVTTADTSIGAIQYESQVYIIEGYDVQQLMGQTVTLSFWVYSSLAGTYCVSFRSTAPTYRSYIAEYTINQANTPEYKTITFTMDNGTVGTWDYTNGTGLTIFFMLACGTSLQSTPNSWQTANVIATSNQVNFLSATSRAFYLYQVQLEVGSVATAFESRPFAEELVLCQRYYEKSYDLSEAPGSNTGNSNGMHTYFSAAAGANYPCNPYTVRKRGAGAVAIYRNTGASGAIDGGANPAAGAVDLGEMGFKVNSTFAADTFYKWHWTADAEL